MKTITIRKPLLYTVILLSLPLCLSAQAYMWNGAYDGTLTVKNNYLGISTDDPKAKLDIQGGADNNGGNDPKAMAFQFRLGGLRHWIRTRHNADPNNPATRNAIDFFLNTSSTAGGSRAPGDGSALGMSITAAGVGVGGVEEPAAKLDIQGGADNNGGNDPKAMAFQFRLGGLRHWIRTRHNADPNNPATRNAIDFFLNSSSTADGSRAPGNGSVLGMSITAAGVGVGGVEEPAAKLDIQGGADHNGGNDPKAMAFQFRLGGLRHWIRTRHNADPNNPATRNAIDFFLNSSSTADGSRAPGNGSVLGMSTTAAGVGIGTEEPTSSLHISKTGTGSTVERGSELYQPAMAVNNALAFQIGRENNVFNAGKLRFIYKGDRNINNVLSLGFQSKDDILNVVATGKVGIGTTEPTAKLEIKDPDVMVKIRNTNDNGGIQILNSYNAAYFGMYNASGSVWGAVPANDSKSFFAIQNDGKVGSVTNSGVTPASFRNVLDDGTGKMGIGTTTPHFSTSYIQKWNGFCYGNRFRALSAINWG